MKVTRFLLPKPSVTRLIPPSKLEGTTSGILKLCQVEGLAGNRIWAMETDRTGAVWISTERGLSKYTGDIFENYTFMEKDPTGALEALWDLELDQNGNLLISTAISGLYRLNIQSGIIGKFETGVSFFRIQEDRNGLIWGAGADDGVYWANAFLQGFQNQNGDTSGGSKKPNHTLPQSGQTLNSQKTITRRLTEKKYSM